MATSTTDETNRENPRLEREAEMLARLFSCADALTASISKLREDEENRIARFERAIDIRSGLLPKDTDPITNFWTVYKKVADEHDNGIASKYVADLDTTLLFSGLFLAVITAFIAISVPVLQSNPGDLSNYLLFLLLNRSSSFNVSDYELPPYGVTSPYDFGFPSPSNGFYNGGSLLPDGSFSSEVPVVDDGLGSQPASYFAQPLFFTSLSLTLFTAFFAVAAKQWILHYAGVKKVGNIADRGRERQVKFAALQKWKVLVIVDLLPIVLQVSLFFFSTGLYTFTFSDGDSHSSTDAFSLTFAGMGLYIFTVLVTLWESGRPFQTPVSVLVLLAWGWVREFWLLTRSFEGFVRSPIGRIAKRTNQGEEDPSDDDHPTLWRSKQLFTSRVREDIAASAAIWLIENSTDLSAAPAVAAAFSEFQWPSHHSHSTVTLTRLLETYTKCLSAHEFDNSTRLKALQSAAAYYVLYHTQFIWVTSRNFKTGLKKLPLDLFHERPEKWGGHGVFEYLLHTEDRSEPVTSARFLSYIAPYWFCSDSDSAVRSRSSRSEKLHELVDVLERSQAFTPTTLANCVLCVGAATGLPLHPEDLIRVDKSKYLQITFKAVVGHFHRLVLAGNRQSHCATALGILLTLAEKPTSPPVDAAQRMDQDTSVLFQRLRGLREEDGTVDLELPLSQDHVHGEGSAGTVPPTTPTPASGSISARTFRSFFQTPPIDVAAV